MTTKTFELGTVLTVTTGRLITKADAEHPGNGIGHLYELLGHMTNEAPFTHSLGRFSDACKPVLLEMFPELAGVDLTMLKDTLDSAGTPQEGIERWLSLASIKFDLKAVYVIPEGCAHVQFIDPVEGLADMAGSEKVIAVTV